MEKEPSYLKRLSERTVDILEGRAAEQSAAICLRGVGGNRQVLLITSRDTGRWVIPKGNVEKKESARNAAEREAREEAGVVGTTSKKAFGHYTYLKGKENIACIVSVFLVEVKEIKASFPEARMRQFEWLPPAEASRRVDEPELKGLLLRLAVENSAPSA